MAVTIGQAGVTFNDNTVQTTKAGLISGPSLSANGTIVDLDLSTIPYTSEYFEFVGRNTYPTGPAEFKLMPYNDVGAASPTGLGHGLFTSTIGGYALGSANLWGYASYGSVENWKLTLTFIDSPTSGINNWKFEFNGNSGVNNTYVSHGRLAFTSGSKKLSKIRFTWGSGTGFGPIVVKSYYASA